MQKKIALTGGHFTPGLAVIEELKKRDWEITWIGINKAISGKEIKTLEAKTLPGLNIPFYEVSTFKFQRTDILGSLFSSWKLGLGLYQSFVILQKVRPSVLLSFGSFVAVPSSIAAWILGIPVVTHEQTTVSGLANRLISFIAEKVAISYPTSQEFFDPKKTIFTGNLLRVSLFKSAQKKLNKRSKIPVLFVTGGSRGSQVINEIISSNLKNLVEKFKIFHQTGETDYTKCVKIKNKLPKNLRSRYVVNNSLTPEDMEKMFVKADILVSRAGANTVSEIALFGIPTIFIPIPWSSGNEQYKNALMLKNLRLAEIIEERDLNNKTFLKTLDYILDNYSKYKRNTTKAKKLVSQDASKKLVDILEEYAHI